MQVNDPVTPVKRCPRRGRLSVNTVGSENYQMMLVNSDFFIKLAATQNNS